nr:hypothetical protein GCM10020092_068150 [Actinoplanes digitatis]
MLADAGQEEQERLLVLLAYLIGELPEHRVAGMAISLPPASESSQLADQVTLVSSPVSSDFGRATGVSVPPAGAVSRCS